MSSFLIFPSMSAYSSQIDNHCGAAAARGARQSAGRAAEGRLQTAYAIASDLNKGRYADCVPRVTMKKSPYPCGVPPIG